MNREQWLTDLARASEEFFREFRIKPYRVTCGWPCKNATAKARRVGECHSPAMSADGVAEIFISPVLADPLEVAGTVCHELAHVVAGTAARHGKGFVKVCRQVGLTKGKPASVEPGEALNRCLKKIIGGLGVYPHAALTVSKVAKLTVPSVIGLECPACGCKVRIGRKCLEESGMPVCGCGNLFSHSGSGESDGE